MYNLRLSDITISAIQTRNVTSSVSAGSIATHSTCELDSHADTSVAGCNFILLESPIRHVDVHGYSPELQPLQLIPIGSAATAWVSPVDGQTYLLILHECIFLGDRLPHSLLCPNQLRANGLIVNDVPVQFDKKSTHSILDPQTDVRIPLFLKHAISYFDSYRPSLEEAQTLPAISLTSPSEWTITSADLPLQEPL